MTICVKFTAKKCIIDLGVGKLTIILIIVLFYCLLSYCTVEKIQFHHLRIFRYAGQIYFGRLFFLIFIKRNVKIKKDIRKKVFPFPFFSSNNDRLKKGLKCRVTSPVNDTFRLCQTKETAD